MKMYKKKSAILFITLFMICIVSVFFVINAESNYFLLKSMKAYQNHLKMEENFFFQLKSIDRLLKKSPHYCETLITKQSTLSEEIINNKKKCLVSHSPYPIYFINEKVQCEEDVEWDDDFMEKGKDALKKMIPVKLEFSTLLKHQHLVSQKKLSVLIHHIILFANLQHDTKNFYLESYFIIPTAEPEACIVSPTFKHFGMQGVHWINV